MSEYRYYEFRAIDRPLTDREIAELRKLSSRARITPTSFVNVYHFGDLRGDPVLLMQRYFDVFVHLEEWVHRWFMVRVPRARLPLREVQPFITESSLKVYPAGRNIVLSFLAEVAEEEAEDVEDEWLPALLSIRDALMGGDRRALYLGWLASVQAGEVDLQVNEPPVPPGLGEMDEPLQSLAKFLGVDRDLLDVAAEASPRLVAQTPARQQILAWLKNLDPAERDAMLLSLLEGKDPHLLADLRRQVLDFAGSATRTNSGGSRRAWDLVLQAERRRRAREGKRRRGSRGYSRHLELLQEYAPELWDEVERLAQTGGSKAQDRVVRLLSDLRELADLEGSRSEFDAELEQFAQQYRKKRSLIERLARAGLLAHLKG